jgi:hypothetical protein
LHAAVVLWCLLVVAGKDTTGYKRHGRINNSKDTAVMLSGSSAFTKV